MDKSKKTKVKSKAKEKPAAESTTGPQKRLALIRIRGKVHLRTDIGDSLRHLNLNNINNCVVIDDRPEYKGMLQKVKDYVTWGEITPETFEKLLASRGRIEGDKRVEDGYVKENTKYGSITDYSTAFIKFETELDEIPGFKSTFKLHPPVGGHERKGIKKPYSLGGVLGYRGETINDLIMKMI